MMPLKCQWTHPNDNDVQVHLSPLMGKPTICIGETKDADQLRGNREADFAVTAKLISAFVFFLLLG